MSNKALLRAPSVHTLSLAFLLLLAFLLGFSFPSTYDPDIWWHLKTGEWISANGHLPWTDPFGANTAGERWIAYSWLAELLFYHADRFDPAFGLRLIQGAVAALTAVVLYIHTRAISGLPRLALVLVLVFLVPVFSWTARPQMFSFLMMAITMLSLWWGQARNRRLLWLLPPLMALWANLHIYFVLGLGIVWLILLWPWLYWAINHFPKAERPSWQGLAVVLLATLAPLANPYGMGLYIEAYRLAMHGSMDWPADVIRELASPNFHDWPRQVFFAWICLACLGFFYARQRPPVLTTFLMFALLFRSLQYGRDIPYFVIIMISFIAERLAGLPHPKLLRMFSGDGAAMISTYWPRAAIHWFLAACFLMSVMAVPIKLWPHKELLLKSRDHGYPAAAVAYMLKERPVGPLYNMLDWGGYLIHALAPTYPVYIDGRTQLYSRAFWEVHDVVRHGKPGWERVLADSGARVVLWRRDQPLTSLLKLTPGWRLVHEDELAVVFVKQEAK